MELTPYLIALDRNSSVPTISAIEKDRISGAIVEVSEYFDVITHKPSNSAVNPKLIRQLNQLTELKLPYGFYTILRSRSTKELNAELSLFFNTIVGIKFDIGLWMQFEFYSSLKSANDQLVDDCATILKTRGYTNQIGLYLDESNLSKITWSNHKNDFLLWLNKPLKSNMQFMSLLNDNIVPEQFFKV